MNTTQDFVYKVGPADPFDRDRNPDAHEVYRFRRGRRVRSVGVWATRHAASAVADALNESARHEVF